MVFTRDSTQTSFSTSQWCSLGIPLKPPSLRPNGVHQGFHSTLLLYVPMVFTRDSTQPSFSTSQWCSPGIPLNPPSMVFTRDSTQPSFNGVHQGFHSTLLLYVPMVFTRNSPFAISAMNALKGSKGRGGIPPPSLPISISKAALLIHQPML